VPFFAKFHKTTKDFLDDKKFKLDRTLVVKTKSTSGVTFTGKTVAECESVKGSLKSEYASSYGTCELEVDTKDLVEASYKTKELTKGLKVEVTGKADKEKGKDKDAPAEQKCNGAVEAKYTQEKVSASVKLNVVHKGSKDEQSLELSGSLSGGSNSFYLGGEATYVDADFSEYNVGLLYKMHDSEVSLKSNKKFKFLNLGYFHSVRPTTDVGVTFDMNVKNFEERGFSLAVEQRLEGDSKVKGMVSKKTDCDAVCFHGLYAANLNPNARLSLSSKLDLPCNKPCLGIKLELGELE